MAYIGNPPAEAYTNTVKDSFNGDGSTVAFTMSQPSVTNDVRVVVENVIQDPTVAYSCSGTTLTFTSAPPSGTNNIYVVHLGPAVMTTVPPSEIASATTFASDVTVQGAFTSQGIDDNATSTAMTLDTSGNLLVGKTSTGLSVTGTQIQSDGRAMFTRDGNQAADFNRKTSDGDIVKFQKDGSTVGSIGTASGNTYIGSGDTGIAFSAADDTVYPITTATGGIRDAAIDLGGSTYRYKDLYLSGGVFLGGTGSSNKLDDYEEGGFTPFSGFGAGYTGEVVENAQYTKIGRMVYINLRIKWTGTDGSGNPARFTMPFSHGTATNTGTTGAIMYSGTQLRSGAAMIAHMATGSSDLYIYSGAGGAFSAITRSEINGAYDFAISFCYYV